MIHEFDWSIGEVMKALDRLKLVDNTLLIVTSDNGGVLDTNGPDNVNSGTVETNNDHPQNGVLRGTKGSPYEGGTRVPCIARWPGHVQTGTSGELICHVDMLATAAALTGQKLAAAAGPDSFNVLPALLGGRGLGFFLLSTSRVPRLDPRRIAWVVEAGRRGASIHARRDPNALSRTRRVVRRELIRRLAEAMLQAGL